MKASTLNYIVAIVVIAVGFTVITSTGGVPGFSRAEAQPPQPGEIITRMELANKAQLQKTLEETMHAVDTICGHLTSFKLAVSLDQRTALAIEGTCPPRKQE